MGHYAQAQPMDENLLEEFAVYTEALERRFTIAGDYCSIPRPNADDPVERLHALLLSYRGRSIELGKSGHPDFGVWMIWAERERPLALVLEDSSWLYDKDGVLVKALTAAEVAQVADALADVKRPALRELFDSEEMRCFAHWITSHSAYTESDEGFNGFVDKVERARVFFAELARNGEAAIIWTG